MLLQNGDEYRRIRGGAEEISREYSYGILQKAKINYALWVERTKGIEIWVPPDPVMLPVCVDTEIPY